MWVFIAIGGFALFVWLGRQVRLGRLAGGPWIRHFRTLRSMAGMACLVLAISLLLRGEVWPAFGALFLCLFLTASVRIQGKFQRSSPGPQPAAAYTAEEIKAYEALGLSIGSDKKAVKEAWKRRMKDAHPDRGGDVLLASRLNTARDVLLRRRS